MTAGFVHRRRVEFRDTDAAGIAHFSVFFVWMEQAEHAALRHLGMSVVAQNGADTVSWPRVSAHCDYRSPAYFEEEVEIHVTLERLGTKSVTYRFEFLSDGRSIATGTLTAVCCQMHGSGEMSAIAIPSEIAERLQQLA